VATTDPTADGVATGDVRPQRLQRGALGLTDITASTMANIGPAMSFFFGFALIAQTAGVASPLTIVAAAVAVALLGNTLAEFSKSIPSTGSFITFVGKAFGPVAAIATTIVVSLGYIIAISAVVAISGGWTSTIIAHYFGVHIAWQWFTAVLTLFAFALVVKGVGVSTKWAGALFFFEMGLLLLVSVWVLISHHDRLSLAPFEPSRLSGGWQGLGLGFPLAVFLFIGWENSAALAEETADPRRAVPRAIYLSIAAMAVSYVLFAYVTVVGFHYDTAALAKADVPFVSVTSDVLGGGVILAYLAGFTSIVGSLISAANSQSRMIFNAAREGMLPRAVASVTPNSRTPWVSFVVYLVIALGLAFGWGWSMDPVEYFGDSATLGSILVTVTWIAANLALPVHYWRHHRDGFSALRHVVLPLLGVAALAFPLYQLVKPGQPAPFDTFPVISAIVLVVSLVYAFVLNARDRTLGDRVGSIIADVD
jgi:amino acid transporter